MAHEGAIIKRFEGKIIDDEFLKAVAAEYNGYIGFVAVHEGSVIVDIKEGGDSMEASLQDIRDTMAEFQPSFSIILGKGVEDEDRQPFTVLAKDESKPLCLVMLEGNFAGSGYEAPGGETHPDEWYVTQQYLLEKLTDLADEYDEDINKMVAYLNKPFKQNEILKSICPLPGARCEVLFFFADGQTVSIRKGDLHKEFDWGETSQALSFAPAAAPAAPARGSSLLAKLGNKGKTSVPSTGSPSSTATPGKTDTAIAAALAIAEANKDDGRPYIKPPGRRCSSAKDLGNFYDHYCVARPEGWEDGVQHSDRAKPALLKKEHWDDQVKWQKTLDKNAVIVVKGGKAPGVVTKDAGSEIKTDLLTAKQRDGLITVMKPKLVTNIDDKSSFVGDPAKMAEELKDRELISQALPGFFTEGIATVFKWRKDAFLLMIKHDPEVAAMVFEEMRLMLWQAHGQAKKDLAAARKAM